MLYSASILAVQIRRMRLGNSQDSNGTHDAVDAHHESMGSATSAATSGR
jgi:hypothetical protein